MAYLIAVTELIEAGKSVTNEAGYLSCADQTCKNDIAPTMQVVIVGTGFGGTILYCDDPKHREGLD